MQITSVGRFGDTCIALKWSCTMTRILATTPYKAQILHVRVVHFLHRKDSYRLSRPITRRLVDFLCTETLFEKVCAKLKFRMLPVLQRRYPLQ